MRAASGGGLWPVLTAAARGALLIAGRDEETASSGRTKKLRKREPRRSGAGNHRLRGRCKVARERGRYDHRDATMILVAYRHGLRAAELCALRCDQVDLSQGLLHVCPVTSGMPSVRPISGGEIRDLRRLKREQIETRH